MMGQRATSFNDLAGQVWWQSATGAGLRIVAARAPMESA
jgi:hypothetical protein